MRNFLLFTFFAIITSGLFAQECSDLFISEYVEGSENNKAIEIYNPTNSSVDLSNYTIRRYSNGSPVYTDEVALSGSIVSKGVVVVTNGQTDSVWVSGGGYWSMPINDTLYEKGDLHGTGEYPTAMYFNGNDAITLEKVTGEIVDIFGKVGTDPGSNGWNDIPPTYYAGTEFWTSWSKDQTLIRKPSVKNGVIDNPVTFMVNVEWDSIAKDNWDSLGYHKCDCGTLGINTIKLNHSVAIYPNPVKNNKFTVSASESINSISIVDQKGSLVYNNTSMHATKDFSLNSSFLNTGVYIIKIGFIDGKTYSNKIIIP